MVELRTIFLLVMDVFQQIESKPYISSSYKHTLDDILFNNYVYNFAFRSLEMHYRRLVSNYLLESIVDHFK